jgi:CRISPR-associated protein Csm4
MRLSFEAYRLSFHSGLHIGTREGALEATESVIRSDTLFSAFVNGYRLLYEGHNFDSLCRQLEAGKSPVRFSSAFPFMGDTFYLPIPRNQIPRSKQAKKVQFVELAVWQRLVNGEIFEDLAAAGAAGTLPPLGNGRDAPKEPLPWTILNTPRVALDRRSNHPGERYFHCAETHFADNAGLYFLAAYRDDEIRGQARAVWRLMADEGLGGDRTVGKGLFAYPRAEQIDLEAPGSASGWISLSLYYPASDEIAGLKDGYYDLIQRRGYIYSQGGRTLRRRPVCMFAEGSVFPLLSNRFGKLVNTTPDRFAMHPVYRSGLALGVPCVVQDDIP